MSNKPNVLRLLERAHKVIRAHKRNATVRSSLELAQLVQKSKGKGTA
jgi:hypothetical protein